MRVGTQCFTRLVFMVMWRTNWKCIFSICTPCPGVYRLLCHAITRAFISSHCWLSEQDILNLGNVGETGIKSDAVHLHHHYVICCILHGHLHDSFCRLFLWFCLLSSQIHCLYCLNFAVLCEQYCFTTVRGSDTRWSMALNRSQ